jgi:hypothetical protein
MHFTRSDIYAYSRCSPLTDVGNVRLIRVKFGRTTPQGALHMMSEVNVTHVIHDVYIPTNVYITTTATVQLFWLLGQCDEVNK